MLASTISGKSGAEMRAHRSHACHVLRQTRATDLHLDGAEALGEVVVGLPQQRIEREVEVDAAGVTRHRRIEAAEQPPQRRVEAPRLQVPQRDVACRYRQAHRTAAAAEMQVPPHLLPQRLDLFGVGAEQHRTQALIDQRVHRGTAGAHGVGVADTLGAVGVAQAHRDQLEMRDGAVGGVRQRDRQSDAIEAGLQ